MKKYILLLGIMFFATEALSQGGEQKLPPTMTGEVSPKQFEEVAKDLRCPTCTGLSVLDSDAAFSVQIKDMVKEQIKQGKSKPEILAYFVDRFGPWILREPPPQGINIFAWAIPLALLVIGPPILWLAVWRKRKVVTTFGVRSADAIVEEMNQNLNQLRSGRS